MLCDQQYSETVNIPNYDDTNCDTILDHIWVMTPICKYIQPIYDTTFPNSETAMTCTTIDNAKRREAWACSTEPKQRSRQ